MFKCYGMDCLGIYSHIPKPNVTRVQSASQWTASVPTLHMPKPDVTRVQSATEWTVSVHTLHMPKPNVTRVQHATQWTASVHTLHMSKPNVTRVQSATVEVPTCDTGFLHEKWPPFWGSSKLTFFENVSCNRPSWYKTYQLSGSHSVKALSPKKSICAQKAINFSIPTKIVVAARQSVKSQLHVSKQPIKNQAVKIGLPKTWPYQTPKRDVRPRHGKKDSKESSPPVWVLWMLETATIF